jgi:hypothetical protein
MIEIAISMCLLADPVQCRYQYVYPSEEVPFIDCKETGALYAKSVMRQHPEYKLKMWTCNVVAGKRITR